jgi:hypothetical protein
VRPTIKQNILAPSGITRLSLANNASPLPNEATYYPLGMTDGWRIHEFDSFGGWVGTLIDLYPISSEGIQSFGHRMDHPLGPSCQSVRM